MGKQDFVMKGSKGWQMVGMQRFFLVNPPHGTLAMASFSSSLHVNDRAVELIKERRSGHCKQLPTRRLTVSWVLPVSLVRVPWKNFPFCRIGRQAKLQGGGPGGSSEGC